MFRAHVIKIGIVFVRGDGGSWRERIRIFRQLNAGLLKFIFKMIYFIKNLFLNRYGLVKGNLEVTQIVRESGFNVTRILKIESDIGWLREGGKCLSIQGFSFYGYFFFKSCF